MNSNELKTSSGFNMKKGLMLAAFMIITLAVFSLSTIYLIAENRKTSDRKFAERWKEIVSNIALKVSPALDKNLSIGDDIALELYNLPSLLDNIEVIYIVDDLNRPVFSVGEIEDNKPEIIQSGLSALSHKELSIFESRRDARSSFISLPIKKSEAILGAIVMEVQYDNLPAYSISTLLASVKKTAIPFTLWALILIFAVYRFYIAREKEENLRLAQYRLSTLGYDSNNLESVAKNALDIMVTSLKLIDACVFIKDRIEGDFKLKGYLSTSADQIPVSQIVFDPSDPRLVSAIDKKPVLYTMSKSGHARLISETDRSEKTRRIALPLIHDSAAIGILDFGIGQGQKVTRKFLSACRVFAESVTEPFADIIEFEDLSANYAKFRRILEMMEMIDSAPDLNSALSQITRNIVEVEKAKFCRIFTIDESGNNLILAAETIMGEGFISENIGSSFKLDEMPIHKVSILSGQSQAVKPEELESIGASKDGYQLEMGKCQILIAPLLLDDIQIGCVSVAVDVVDEIPEEFKAGMEYIVRRISPSILRSQSNIRLKRSFDRLTASQDQTIQNERLSAITSLAGGISENLDELIGYFENVMESLPIENSGDDMELNSMIKKKMENYRRMTSRFKAYAEIGQGGSLQQVEIAEIVNKVSKILYAEIEKDYGNKIALEVKISGSGQIYGDRRDLEVMIREIIGNSIEAMPGGGKVVIESIVDRDFAVIEISDQGSGIADKFKERVFEPFVTSRDGIGRGLGLSIVYGIVTSHNGRIELESGSGKGTKIKIMIPLVDPEQTALYSVKKGTSKRIPLSSS